VFAQVKNENIVKIEKVVADIRSKSGAFKKAELFRDSTGTRSAFLKGKELVMVRAEMVDHHVVTKKIEWYFSNGHLIYCEQLWTVISSGHEMNHEKLYLVNDKLIEWVKTDGKPADPNSNDFKETGFYLAEYGRVLKKETADKTK
jgi:hypothetical protein